MGGNSWHRCAVWIALVYSCGAADRACSLVAPPEARVMLFGGAKYSPQGLQRFVELAGGTQAKIVYIPWANLDDDGNKFITAVAGISTASVVVAPPRDQVVAREKALNELLNHATGVFFGGGGQQHIMETFAASSAAYSKIHHRSGEGVVIGGTSAGLAILSERMISGAENNGLIDEREASKLTQGLGLLKGVLIDQHFLVRKRMNRLLSALLGSAERLGIGVDEQAAAELEDGHRLKVYGPGQVVVFSRDPHAERRFSLDIVRAGETYDLDAGSRVE